MTATVALSVLIVAGAACSSSSKADSAAKPSASTASTAAATPTPAKSAGSGNGPNPCTIVTAAEVQAILGAAATPTGPTEAHRGTNCTWHPGNGGSVLVQVYQGKEFFDPSMQAPSAKKINGLGDDAYLDAFGTTRTAVGFLKGDTAVFIDGFQITSSDSVVAAARDAASKV